MLGSSQDSLSALEKHYGFNELPEPKALTGSELEKLSDEALMHRVQDTNVFAEVEPNQKERIIIALKKAGNVVGYLGDGINDASALHVGVWITQLGV